MKNALKIGSILSTMAFLKGCIVTNPIPSGELQETENSAYTSEGLLFVARKNSSGESWIFVIIRNETDSHSFKPFVKGTTEGTENGEIGSELVGEECRFSGLASNGMDLHATCINESGILNLGAQSVTLCKVDTNEDQELIKTGFMSNNNFLPGADEAPFDPN